MHHAPAQIWGIPWQNIGVIWILGWVTVVVVAALSAGFVARDVETAIMRVALTVLIGWLWPLAPVVGLGCLLGYLASGD